MDDYFSFDSDDFDDSNSFDDSDIFDETHRFEIHTHALGRERPVLARARATRPAV